MWASKIIARKMTREGVPKAVLMTELQKSRLRTGALQQVSEGRGRQASLPGTGGGFSSRAGQVIPQRAQDHCGQSRDWYILLVHPAQTCLPEPNRQGWLSRKTSSELWDGGVGQSEGLPSILLTSSSLSGGRVWSAWAQGMECQPDAHLACPRVPCYGCHDPPQRDYLY